MESPVELPTSQEERHRLPTDTESNMDETSSTMAMIAQSKALFDRLETEAKVRITSACLQLSFEQAREVLTCVVLTTKNKH